ncbi:MAG TPA: 6-phosphogluconolactonase [Candidatus Bathyarchaeia archaeon]|nr:6-phosphogluconolactonase [Candidatus Bathyarchaeia archaeon]
MNNKPAERRISLFPNKKTMDGVLVEEWASVSREAVLRRGRFVAALSGGETPVSFYEHLAASGRDLPWEKTHIFQVDERLVPEDHPASNMRLIEAKLLRHVPIPGGNIHQVPSGHNARAAAARYEKEIRVFFGLAEFDLPHFDLILLGLGEDGHTASLFPGSENLRDTRRLAVEARRPAPDHDRVSLSLGVLNAGHAVVFLVTGDNKASALKDVLEGPDQRLPAALVRPRDGRFVFLFDKAAGQLLKSPPKMTRVLP